MTKIRIERLNDSYECDDCGWSSADGAKVYFDDKLELDLTPHAYCFDGDDYNDQEIFKAILLQLGHEVEIINGPE